MLKPFPITDPVILILLKNVETDTQPKLFRCTSMPWSVIFLLGIHSTHDYISYCKPYKIGLDKLRSIIITNMLQQNNNNEQYRSNLSRFLDIQI